jgi:dihydrodipicolinate synthase/N-acetylneuraminate lyase
MPAFPQPSDWVQQRLLQGLVIPAHPLALKRNRKLDERHQRALTRYYHAAGAGGIAVGVHTTQFAIRDPAHALLGPVLQLAAQTLKDCDSATGRQSLKIAGICGQTAQAVAEAAQARELGYHAGLLSLAALKDGSDRQLVRHCQEVGRELPLVGFYLQPAAGGRLLSFRFWSQFVEIPNVVAIKIAPFNRYQTLDVMRALAESGRVGEIALYTGNDDNIVADLLTAHVFPAPRGQTVVRIAGGLLGHWACWTRSAVDLLDQCKRAREANHVPAKLLSLGAQITDCNAAFFDAAHGFAGCIPGIHEVLRRQGLLSNTCCLNPLERLSPGQRQEIDRVCRWYPHLNDDVFVQQHLDAWLR